MQPEGFRVETFDEEPGPFHSRTFDGLGRALWVPALDERRFLVMGSSQREADIDSTYLERAGIELVRRRSGGGAVLVSASDVVWFDVIVNEGDPVWDHDVGRSFDWLGEACQVALGTLGVEAAVHHGNLERTAWSSRVCFAGLGPGELTVDGRKLVGMSQRRTRASARFQVAVLRRWNGRQHRDFFLDPSHDEGGDAHDRRDDWQLDDVATHIPHSPDEILTAVTTALMAY